MVKNTGGGNKSKKQARKNINASMAITEGVRRVNDESEMYAVVTKIYSAKRCDVIGSDGKTRQCNVRGKFLKKRGDVSLSPGVWIMIGFYDWEVRSDGNKTCDLLEIYTSLEKDKLKQIESSTKLSAIISGDITATSAGKKITSSNNDISTTNTVGNDNEDEDNLIFSNFHINNKIPENIKQNEQLSSSETSSLSNEDQLDTSSTTYSVKNNVAQKPNESLKTHMDWLTVNVDDI